MVDVTKLTDRELKELFDAANEERGRRSYRCKASSGLYKRLHDNGFVDFIKKEGMDGPGSYYNESENQRNKIVKAIYVICDLALGNYTIRGYAGRHRGKPIIEHRLICNGSKLYDGIYEEYMEMSEELMDIFDKYFERRIKNELSNNKG